MEPILRHQCLIYDGPPSRQLPSLVAAMRERLRQNFRCLYLNSAPMVAGIKSYLMAHGVDVTGEIRRGNLVLSAEQSHLVDGHFEVERMMQSLRDAVEKALEDGYAGLWATGDMTWEFGPDRDFSKLVEYEWRLEQYFHEQPALSGICQYHAGTLPRDTLRHAFVVHPTVFVNETLSLINHHHIPREKFADGAVQNPEIEEALHQLCQPAELRPRIR